MAEKEAASDGVMGLDLLRGVLVSVAKVSETLVATCFGPNLEYQLDGPLTAKNQKAGSSKIAVKVCLQFGNAGINDFTVTFTL